MGDLSLGIFAYPGSQVARTEKRGLGFQCLSPTRVSIHPQRGGMCCSPNNARFMIAGPTAVTMAAKSAVAGLSYFWSVAVTAANKRGKQRVCVSLQWLLTDQSTVGLRAGISDAVESCESLDALLPRLTAVLMQSAAETTTTKPVLRCSDNNAAGGGDDDESPAPAVPLPAAAVAALKTFSVEFEGVSLAAAAWPPCDGARKTSLAPSAGELEELNRVGGGRGKRCCWAGV